MSNTLHSGILKPIVQGESPQGSKYLRRYPIPYHENMQQLLRFVTTRVADNLLQQMYLSATNSLMQSFAAICDGITRTDEQSRLSYILFAWAYRLESDFIDALQQRQPVSLIILAHFVVLMKQMDDMWIFKGWPEHIIDGIRGSLDKEDHIWIKWPMEHVGIN